MSYTTINALDTFGFKDAYVDHFEITEEQMDLHLEAVIVRGENPNNSHYVDSYAGDLVLSLQGMKIVKAYQEGFKYYNANDELVKEIPNKDLEIKDFIRLFKSLEQPYFYAANRLSGDEKIVYEFALEEVGEGEGAGETYWFVVECEKVVVSWEKFLNRVQN